MLYIVYTLYSSDTLDDGLVKANRSVLAQGREWFKQPLRALDPQDVEIIKTTARFVIVEHNGYTHVTLSN